MLNSSQTQTDTSTALSESSVHDSVPGSISALFRQHGVDVGADSRQRLAQLATPKLSISSAVLAFLGFCQGVAISFADGWKPIPTCVGVFLGIAMALISLRFNNEPRPTTSLEIVASLFFGACVVIGFAITPEISAWGMNLRTLLTGSVLIGSTLIVVLGFADRYGSMSGWGRTAAPTVVLAATLIAMT